MSTINMNTEGVGKVEERPFRDFKFTEYRATPAIGMQSLSEAMRKHKILASRTGRGE